MTAVVCGSPEALKPAMWDSALLQPLSSCELPSIVLVDQKDFSRSLNIVHI